MKSRLNSVGNTVLNWPLLQYENKIWAHFLDSLLLRNQGWVNPTAWELAVHRERARECPAVSGFPGQTHAPLIYDIMLSGKQSRHCHWKLCAAVALWDFLFIYPSLCKTHTPWKRTVTANTHTHTHSQRKRHGIFSQAVMQTHLHKDKGISYKTAQLCTSIMPQIITTGIWI